MTFDPCFKVEEVIILSPERPHPQIEKYIRIAMLSMIYSCKHEAMTIPGVGEEPLFTQTQLHTHYISG